MYESQKYIITAKKGDKRIFLPILQGNPWTEHEYYGKKCTVIESGYIYDVHCIHIDGMPKEATWWANGYELKERK